MRQSTSPSVPPIAFFQLCGAASVIVSPEASRPLSASAGARVRIGAHEVRSPMGRGADECPMYLDTGRMWRWNLWLSRVSTRP